MTIVVMSQPTQCTYIGAGEGALRAPFEPPPSGRPRPPVHASDGLTISPSPARRQRAA